MRLTYSRRQFAKLAGVTPAAVTGLIRRGTLVLERDDRLDAEHSKNAAYIEARKVRAASGKRQNQRPSKGGESTPPTPPKATAGRPRASNQGGVKPKTDLRPPQRAASFDPDEIANLAVQKDREEILLKRERRRNLVVQRAEKLGRLIQRDYVREQLATLGADLNVRLLQLPRRIGPQIVALVEAGKGDQVEAALEHELSDVIKRAKKAATIAD